jgi:hypothetical protein
VLVCKVFASQSNIDNFGYQSCMCRSRRIAYAGYRTSIPIILNSGPCTNEHHSPPCFSHPDRWRQTKNAGPRASLAANGDRHTHGGCTPAWASAPCLAVTVLLVRRCYAAFGANPCCAGADPNSSVGYQMYATLPDETAFLSAARSIII